MKTALIFGAGGQAGYYMTKFLNEKGYDVTALSRNDCSVSDSYNVSNVLIKFKPDEVYNFASKMFAPDSWMNPWSYMDVNCMGVLNILESYYAVRPDGKFFQASSADIFALGQAPQRENTLIKPRSPYGIAKVAAQELVRIYREEKKMFACTGILFNMESPRRKETFFSRKVVTGVVDIKEGRKDKLSLGDLTAVRDWGVVEEYVEAMWLMLQDTEPNDYVIGTGIAASCVEFVREACDAVGIDFDSRIEYRLDWKNPPDSMYSDPGHIYRKLGWKAKTKFPAVVRWLVTEELKKTMGVLQ